jgi:excisionase family DNA binding protein
MSAETKTHLLTPNEVAERLRVGKSTVYKLIASGELPSVRVASLLRVRVSDLEKFLEKSAI